MSEKDKIVSGIIDNIRRLYQVINERSREVERETGLTGPQAWAIKAIAQYAPVRVSDLAQKMYLQPPTIVGILDRLEAKGLVFRTRSTQDRRVVEIDLTQEGYQLVNLSPEATQHAIIKGLELLQDDKLMTINQGLEQLTQLLNIKEVPPKLLGTDMVNMPIKI